MRRLVLVFALVCALLVPAARASGVDTPYAIAVPASFVFGYVTPVIAAAPGGMVTFLNLDVAPHDVVAKDAYGPDDKPWCVRFGGRCPLFASKVVGMNGQAPVLGLEQVEKGKNYEFVCSIHSNMTGLLVVPS